MFEYALRKSYEEMIAVIRIAEEDLNNEELKKEVNFRVVNFLHCLFDYYERLEKNEEILIDCNDKQFFSGLRYANNKLKHDPSVLKVYQRTGGFSFPIEFPLIIEKITFNWDAITEDENPRNQKQYQNYIAHIQGKEIIRVSKDALERLKKSEG
ncbi:hypothetical protein FXB42_05480 [Acetobacterium wieringae]|uniref:Uncharacterized protein n=1 Tax=Acetobacterium wieringae TaxID=52694 RepID=A0A5D0WSX6_9FIRM|nr:hypothetical protein [Acetobacterium wieringae]TYC87113.1 hypothetical protein FXB42_05480 [Acetobacterium wieringae]